MSKNQILEDILKEVDKHPEIMSRREALKYLTLSPLAASVIAGTTIGTSEVSASSDVKGKIVIVGGGLGGMSTAARLNNSINNADITVIEPDPLSVSYQPGQTLVAEGMAKFNEGKGAAAGTYYVNRKVQYELVAIEGIDDENPLVDPETGASYTSVYALVEPKVIPVTLKEEVEEEDAAEVNAETEE